MLPDVLRRGMIAFTLLAPLWCQAAPVKDPSGGNYSVDYSRKSNVIRVEASDARLLDLVEEMAKKAGFRLLGPAPPDIVVSIRKMNRLDRVLFELLDRESVSFMFLYDNLKTGKLAEVVILGKGAPDGRRYTLPVNIADRVPEPGDDDAGDESAPEEEGK